MCQLISLLHGRLLNLPTNLRVNLAVCLVDSLVLVPQNSHQFNHQVGQAYSPHHSQHHNLPEYLQCSHLQNLAASQLRDPHNNHLCNHQDVLRVSPLSSHHHNQATCLHHNPQCVPQCSHQHSLLRVLLVNRHLSLQRNQVIDHLPRPHNSRQHNLVASLHPNLQVNLVLSHLPCPQLNRVNSLRYSPATCRQHNQLFRPPYSRPFSPL